MSHEYHIGVGYDLHPASAGRPLFLGGLRIENDFGLVGHGDGDVVLHAIMDAMFGAAGLPDVVERFPEDLQQLAHSLGLPVDSLHDHGVCLASTEGDGGGRPTSQVMLDQALQDLAEQQWTINNVDVTIMARRPQLSPYKLSIRKSLSELLKLDWQHLSVKANANPGIDAVEQARAVACHAALTLRR